MELLLLFGLLSLLVSGGLFWAAMSNDAYAGEAGPRWQITNLPILRTLPEVNINDRPRSSIGLGNRKDKGATPLDVTP